MVGWGGQKDWVRMVALEGFWISDCKSISKR